MSAVDLGYEAQLQRRRDAIAAPLQALYDVEMMRLDRVTRVMNVGHADRLRAMADRLDDEMYAVQAGTSERAGRPNAVWPGILADAIRHNLQAIVETTAMKGRTEHDRRHRRDQAPGTPRRRR